MAAADFTGEFSGFGPSAYFSTPRRLNAWEVPRDGKARRRWIRESAPARPGVYGMIDDDGELIYVGKSKNLANRWMSYFPAQPNREKSTRIGRRAKHLVWENSAHEFLALLRELELIRRFSPKFNVEGRPERQRPAYIYLTTGAAPYFRVGGSLPSGCTTWFGPLQGVSRFGAAVEQLNRRFGLRDCSAKTPMLFADQRDLFAVDRKAACLRYDLGTCLGPCAALCTARDYSRSVERAVQFLGGEDRSLLNDLESSMRAAAAAQQFERAAALRDAWRPLATLHRSLARLRELQREFSFVYELRCRQGQRVWVFLRDGHAVGAQIKPANPRGAHLALQRLDEAYSSDAASHDAIDLDMLRLVGGWFQRRELEIKSTRRPAAASAFCQALLAERNILRRPKARL